MAVILNGRVAATGLTFSLPGSGSEQFSLVVSERALRPGRNRWRLLLVGAIDTPL